MKQKPKLSKPRDPFVQHMVKRKQGPQVESSKAKRSKTKAELRRTPPEFHFEVTA